MPSRKYVKIRFMVPSSQTTASETPTSQITASETPTSQIPGRLEEMFVYFDPSDHRKAPEVGKEFDLRTYLPHKGANLKLMHPQRKYVVDRIEEDRYTEEVIHEWFTCIVYLKVDPEYIIATPGKVPRGASGSRIA